MSMPIISNAQPGDLHVLIYDFVSGGDVLPLHNHTPDSEHIIIVARGSVRVRIQMPDGGFDQMDLDTGTMIDTFAGFPHEVTSLVDGARTIHIQKKTSRRGEKNG